MSAFRFSLVLRVRDYECDFQGIVNNAVYLNYLEHTRHVFARSIGMDVVELARRGINLVVIRMEIDYKGLLRSGDRFLVGLNTERISRVRIGFNQEIYRLKPCENPEKDAVQTDGASETVEMEKRILQARTTVTAVNERGRPCLTPELERLLGEMAL